ncbi:MAG TPA: hypothetical protein VKY26_09300, partial [Actinomycetota bacterium]|nr:hypothetical protein [Actinomycetota bacterium]
MHTHRAARLGTTIGCLLVLVTGSGLISVPASRASVPPEAARAARAAVPALIPGVTAGGVFLTGHDPDYHAVAGPDQAGAKDLIQKAVSYVTFAAAAPRMLLVTHRTGPTPSADYADPALGMEAAGYSFDIADDGTAGGSVLNLATVNFENYDVIVVASDHGGWLTQGELTILDARAAELVTFVNSGGGIVAFAESGDLAGSAGLTTGGQFGFLPYVVSSATLNEPEAGNTVTPFGASIGV